MITIKQFLTGALLFYASAVQAQYKWELKKQSEGITVYTATVPGSDFKAFKGITAIPASNISEITAVLIDVGNFINIFPDTRSCKLISKSGDANIIHYLRTHAPWPVNDREGIYELKSQYDKSKQEVHIDIRCFPYEYPSTKDVVRMTNGKGYWQVKELKSGLYEVTWQFHGDPAGSVPAWLANAFVVDQPYKSLQNIRQAINEGKYNNAKVDFVE